MSYYQNLYFIFYRLFAQKQLNQSEKFEPVFTYQQLWIFKLMNLHLPFEFTFIHDHQSNYFLQILILIIFFRSQILIRLFLRYPKKISTILLFFIDIFFAITSSIQSFKFLLFKQDLHKNIYRIVEYLVSLFLIWFQNQTKLLK